MARYTYRMQSSDEGYLAECLEMDIAGEGATQEAAIQALRKGIDERRHAPDAIAPPSKANLGGIELVAAPPEPVRSPEGPGELAPSLVDNG